jgi:CPA2 family monovalent cation:H+ antiporter-2
MENVVFFDHVKIKILMIFVIGFSLACVFGYFSHRAKLSPIFGYLLAGYCIGPYSPGYVVDLQIAEQLAEVGVVLMMFSVGLHFEWQDLVKTKHIAIPGAIGQTLVASISGILLLHIMGFSLSAGIIFGFAIGVASTVVLVRVLAEFELLHTFGGHISAGWLIVEDLFTVVALLLLPNLASSLNKDGFAYYDFSLSFLFLLAKFFLFLLIMFTVGRRVVSYFLSKIENTRSHELFTLSILASTFLIASCSAFIFGASLPLGSLVAGMVMRQTPLRHRVSLNVVQSAFNRRSFYSVPWHLGNYPIDQATGGISDNDCVKA